KEVLHGASARLDRSRRKGGRATSCHEDAVNPNRLGASDRLRDELATLGVLVEDSRDGQRWRISGTN
ncbi:MAG: hypothetical protein ACKODF_02245, partial [Candidatus Limnocylindrus sp.]